MAKEKEPSSIGISHDAEVHDARPRGGVDRHADDGGVGAHDRVAVAVTDLEREHDVLGRVERLELDPDGEVVARCACRARCCHPRRPGGRSGTGPAARRRAARRLSKRLGRRRHRDERRVDDRHAGALGHEALPEDAGRFAGLALGDELAVAEHHPAVADAAHGVGRVRHQQDGAPLPLELVDPVEALALEALVADGQHLVDHEDVGVHVHGDGEARAARTCPTSRT